MFGWYFALFAFDATWALIKSLEALCSSTINNASSSCLSFNSSSFCYDSRFIQSNLLLNQLGKTNFLGVSGPVQFGENQTDRIKGSYYSIKNVQPSVYGLNYVFVLEYSDPGNLKVPLDENIIIWPGNTLTPPTGRASLKGITLRVGIIQSVPFTIVQKTTDSNGQTTLEYIGFIPDLLERLKTDIGINPILQLAPSNQTYDQLVETVNKGINDIVIGDITVNSKRRKLVGFSNAISETSTRLITRNTPYVNVDLFGCSKPFTVKLWILILATCIASGILMCIIERKDNESLTDRSVSSQLALSMWYAFANMVGYGADFAASNAAGRLLTSGLYILSLIIVASYTANLASDLTLAKSQFVISGIGDLKSGKVPPSRIGVRVGTVAEAYYLSHISRGNKNFYPLTTRQNLYDNLLAGNIDVSFTDEAVGIYVTNNVYCNLTLVGDNFDTGIFAIVTPKNWLYAQDLDVTLLLLKETGYIDDLRQKWFEVRNCPDADTTRSTAMSIEAVGGVLIKHENVIAAMTGQKERVFTMVDLENDIYIAYLPLAHILELCCEILIFFMGIKCGYSSPQTLTGQSTAIKRGQKDDLQVLRPHLMTCVPTILDRIHKAVNEKINQSNFVTRQLFYLSYKIKVKRLEIGLDKLVFSRFNQLILGGRVKTMLCGGAVLSEDTQRFVQAALCVTLFQGNSLTETCAGGTIADHFDITVGRAGYPLVSCEICLVDWDEGHYKNTNKPNPRGEIFIEGKVVANGYFGNTSKKENENFKEINRTRYFCTSDIGEFFPDETLQIIGLVKNFISIIINYNNLDRKKDLVK
ncbi:unnamed protein product [Rotaria sp. Silwood2]|nr:unnamed protein product [Rotaria sp. Silwood2]